MSGPAGAGRVAIVVPCFNEASRLDRSTFADFFAHDGVHVLFVDDGSTDDTLTRLREFARGVRADVLALERNVGKGEAVRQGMKVAMERCAEIVGYFDADGSTPAREALRLLSELESRRLGMVFGSRVATLGVDIRRNALRHYSGRVFATGASLALDLVVYDTQCGAKWVRSGAALGAALEEPFISRWAFDVELLGRVLIGNERVEPLGVHEVLEVPLAEWRDVAGSKLRPWGMVKSGLELARIASDLRRRRARAQR